MCVKRFLSNHFQTHWGGAGEGKEKLANTIKGKKKENWSKNTPKTENTKQDCRSKSEC